MSDPNSGGNKRLKGIIIAIILPILLYWLFYSGDKTSNELSQVAVDQPADSNVSLPNVDDATTNIKQAQPLAGENNKSPEERGQEE